MEHNQVVDKLRSTYYDFLIEMENISWRTKDIPDIGKLTTGEVLHCASSIGNLKFQIMIKDSDFLDKLSKTDPSSWADDVLDHKFTADQEKQIDDKINELYSFLRQRRGERQQQLLLRQKLSENLNQILTENNMSQRQLVLSLQKHNDIKINASQFSKMFSPNNSVVQEPSIQLLCAIADYFNVSLDRLVNGDEPKSNPSIDFSHMTYNDFIRLINLLEEHKYIFLLRNEKSPLTTTGDPGDVDVTVQIHSNSDGTGGDDGTIVHYLSMYTSLKKHFPDTPEGRRMVNEMKEMMLKTVSDIPLFPDLN